jgi:DHA1 family bicyclomycin/chloramphenicol resistance-like MFS transporter
LLEQSQHKTEQPATQRNRVRLLALLVAMSGVGSLSLNILVPALPSLAMKFDADPAHVELTVSLYILGLAAAQLIFGPLSDRFGRRRVVLAGLALATVASTSAIFAGGIASLVAWRVLQSLGASSGQTIGRAIIRDLYERDRAASMIGLVTSVVVLMPMAAPLIGGILDTLLGWEAVFVFSAALSVLVLAWAALALPETHKGTGERNRFRSDLRALAASPRFFGYALCAGLGSAPFFSFLGGAPHVVISMLGRTSAEYGLWFFIPSLGFMAGNFIVSRVATRLGIDMMIWWGIT